MGLLRPELAVKGIAEQPRRAARFKARYDLAKVDRFLKKAISLFFKQAKRRTRESDLSLSGVQGDLRTRWARRLVDNDQTFLAGLAVLTGIVAAPSKFLYYVAPPLFLIIAALTGRFLDWTRFASMALLVTALSGTSLLLGYLMGHQINLGGAVLCALMLLPIAIYFSFSQRFAVGEALFEKIRRLLCYFIFVQSAAVLIELIWSLVRLHQLVGDYVSGTYGLTDIFAGGVTISQVFFTFNIFCIVMFLLAGRRTRLVDAACLLGLLSCIIAQSGHQTIFFVALLGVMAMAQIGDPRRLLGIGVTGLVTVVLLNALYPGNLEGVSMWFNKIVDNPDSLKRTVVRHWSQDIADTKTVLIGTGIGQYTSRGALFSSGYAMRATLPAMLVGQSDYFADYVKPAITRYRNSQETSAISQPYFSILSIISEFGVPAALILFSALLKQVVAGLLVSLDRTATPLVRGLGRYQFFFPSFLILCCFVENYLEFVQALFVPVLLCGIASARRRMMSTF